MLRREVAELPGAGDLVGLLEVLAGVARIRGLRRKGVVGHAFELLGPAQVARDAQHPFQGIHHLDGGAEFGAAGRLAELGHFIPGPEARGKAEGAAQGLQSRQGCRPVAFVLGALPPDNGFLETLPQIDAVEGVLAREEVLAGKDLRPGVCLAVDQVAEFQQEGLSGAVVEPPDHLEIVAAPPFAPVRPVLQRVLRQMGQFIAEISRHHRQDPGVGGRHVILLQDFEGHHLGPPVFGIAALQAFDIGTGNRVAEVAVFPGGSEYGFGPAQGLGDERLVVQDIGQGQEAVDPIRAALPGIPFSADPGVVVTHDLRIERIQVSGHPVPLPFQLVQQPSLGLDRAERKFREGVVRERGAVEDDRRTGRCRDGVFLRICRQDGQDAGEQQGEGQQKLFHYNCKIPWFFVSKLAKLKVEGCTQWLVFSSIARISGLFCAQWKLF